MSLWTIQNGSTTEFIRLDSDGISLLRNVATPLTLEPGDGTISIASSTSDVGGALEIKAGDGNGTDQNGGATSVYPGKSTGTGLSCVRLGRNGRAASTGSTLNAVQDGLIVACEKVLSTESITSFFEVAVADNTMGGGHIDFTITATDGTDYVAHTGSAYYSFCSKAGTMDADIAEITPAAGGEVESSSSAAAITSGWSIVEDEANNKVTVRITATVGSMTATSVKMYAMIANNSMNAITLL
jgi:hypothetical protein